MTSIPRRIFLLCAAAWLGACAAGPGTGSDPDAVLPVMSFNIRYGTAPDSIHAWPHRRALLMRVIAEQAPAVLGVQEALRFQLDEIKQQFARLEEVGAGRDDGRAAGEYSAVLYDGQRLAVLEQGTFWLSDTPEVPGSRTWGNRYPRLVTWARLRDRANGRTFYVFNTHWDHESQPARMQGAALTMRRIQGRSFRDPFILMGDFNAGEDNPAFALLLSDTTTPLRDTFRQLHPDVREVGTYHAFRGQRSGARIDAILVSPEWQVRAAAIVRTSENGRYPSDHFPVTARLLLR